MVRVRDLEPGKRGHFQYAVRSTQCAVPESEGARIPMSAWPGRLKRLSEQYGATSATAATIACHMEHTPLSVFSKKAID